MQLEIYFSEWQNANIREGLTEVKGELVEHSHSTRELPKDIGTFSFCKFAETYFQVSEYTVGLHSMHSAEIVEDFNKLESSWLEQITFSFLIQEGFVYAMAKTPLPSSLLRLKSKTAEAEAVVLFKLVSHSITVCCVCIEVYLFILTR